MTVIRRLAIMLLASMPLLIPAAHASTWPSGPVRIVVPFTPGGTSDAVARTVSEKLTLRWKQPVVIENRPGAGGGIGAQLVARSAPDGLTLFMGSSAPLVVRPSIYRDLPYDPDKDFAPVAFLVNVQNMLVTRPGLGVKNLADLIRLAKQGQKTLSVASNGIGSSPHMSAALFQLQTGTKMTHVPYKGSAPALSDLVGGQVDLMFDNLPTALPMVKGGKLTAIAVTGSARSPLAPSVPTVAESGLPGYDVTVWYGILAPAGTPAKLVEKISTDIAAVLSMEDVRKRLVEFGTEPGVMNPERFTAFMRAERAKWGRIVEQAGIRGE